MTRHLFTFQVGDLVRPRTDPATLCEVIGAEDQDQIQIRGLDWPAGYSALIPADDIYLVSHIEGDKLEYAG